VLVRLLTIEISTEQASTVSRHPETHTVTSLLQIDVRRCDLLPQSEDLLQLLRLMSRQALNPTVANVRNVQSP